MSPSLLLALLALLALRLSATAAALETGHPLVWLDSSCATFQHQLSASAANLTACMGEAARPFVLCRRCADAYTAMEALQTELQGYPHCSSYLLQSDSVQVLVRTRQFAESVWLDAGCAQCLQPAPPGNATGGGSVYRADVADFLRHGDRLRTCFANYTTAWDDPDTAAFNGSSAALCTACVKDFRELNDHFQRLDHNQQHCMDALDALNVSRRMWGEKFRCDPQGASLQPLPLIVAAYIVAVLFYVGARGQGEIKKRRLLRQKRVGSIAGGPGLPDGPHVLSTNAG